MQTFLFFYFAVASLFFLSFMESAEEDRPRYPMLSALVLPSLFFVSMFVFPVALLVCKLLGVDTREIF